LIRVLTTAQYPIYFVGIKPIDMRIRLLLLGLFQSLHFLLLAQAGSLDLSYSGNGKQMTQVGLHYSYAYGISLQADKKILMAGYCDAPNLAAIGIVRYLPNGSLDNSFGSGGKASVGVTGRTLIGGEVLQQPDGKLLVSGSSVIGSYDTFFITRLTPTGVVDNTFGTAGWTFLPHYGAGSLTLQPDGKILAGGRHVEGAGNIKSDKRNFALIRLNANGTLDNTFGSGGTVITDVGGQDEGGVIALLSDGRILFSGERGQDSLEVLRYLSNGALDPTFGANGLTSVTVGNEDLCGLGGMTVQPDQKIVLAGYYITPAGERDVLVVRLQSNGVLDLGFAGNGKKGISFNMPQAQAVGVAMGSNGKIVVGVSAYPSGGPGRFGACRLLSDGSLDASYGTGGITSFSWTGGNGIINATCMARQPDGQLLIGGYNSDEFSSMRILGSGTNSSAAGDVGTAATKGNQLLSSPAIPTINVFPNPAAGQLRIIGLPADEPVLLTVADLTGRIVLQHRTTGGNVLLDISRLAPASYALTIAGATTHQALSFVKASR
jgi:uncharacterized delta-60 repeat protein